MKNNSKKTDIQSAKRSSNFDSKSSLQHALRLKVEKQCKHVLRKKVLLKFAVKDAPQTSQGEKQALIPNFLKINFGFLCLFRFVSVMKIQNNRTKQLSDFNFTFFQIFFIFLLIIKSLTTQWKISNHSMQNCVQNIANPGF